jgi:hypothetical protein
MAPLAGVDRQHAELVHKSKHVKARAGADNADLAELKYHTRVNKPKRERLEATLAFTGQWLVILYHPGASSSSCTFLCAPGMCPSLTLSTDLID